MLHITPETLQYIRQEQARYEAAERRRIAVAVTKPARRLHYKTHERLVDNVILVLRSGVPTKFEYEGACRHGLRVALIFQGWSWRDADDAASDVVQAGLKRAGAERPTWNEGQVDYATAHRVERYGCARCGTPIDEDRQRNGTAAKYCSDLCGNAARQAKARASGERVSLAERLAALALKHEETLRERSGFCEKCSLPFISARANQRFCSLRCAGEGSVIRAPKPCAQCGVTFKPRMKKGNEAKYCSKECTAAAFVVPRPEKTCPTCKTIFRSPRKTSVYCSHKCFIPYNARSRRQSAFACEEAV